MQSGTESHRFSDLNYSLESSVYRQEIVQHSPLYALRALGRLTWMLPRASSLQKRNEKAEQDSGAEFWRALKRIGKHVDAAVFKQLVLRLLFLRALSQIDPQRPETSAETAMLRDSERWRTIVEAALNMKAQAAIQQAFLELAPALGGSFASDVPGSFIDERICYELILTIDAVQPTATQPLLDLLPNLYAFCLREFAAIEGRPEGEHETPPSIAKLLYELAAPWDGVLYDPCCGSAGLLINAWLRSRAKGGQRSLTLYGQESNASTWRIARMNLLMRGIPHNLGLQHADVFRLDHYADLKASYILADPPFNVDGWAVGDSVDDCWEFGTPPNSNSNFAWIQHIIRHLAPDGVACVTMSHATLSSHLRSEYEIRRKIIEADLLDCIVSLPGPLLPGSRNSTCIWVLNRNKRKQDVVGTPTRNRERRILFIDSHGQIQERNGGLRALDDTQIERVVKTYHAWRGGDDNYCDEPGFCREATLQDIAADKFQLVPGRCVGMARASFEDVSIENIGKLLAQLDKQFETSRELESLIRERIRNVVS